MANRTRDECNKKKSMINKNTDKNDQNISSDDDDQGEAKENEFEDLVMFCRIMLLWALRM